MILKKIIALFILISPIGLSHSHDIHAALFQLYIVDNTYFIDIRLDRKDLENALNNECGVNMKMLSSQEKNQRIEEYILDRFWINFDEQIGTYRLASYTYDQVYITVRGVFDAVKIDPNLSEITVFNTCMIDINEKHNNLIHVNLKNRMRSFRLNKDRQKTIIEY